MSITWSLATFTYFLLWRREEHFTTSMKRNIFIFCKLPRSKLYIKADIEKCLSPEACVDIECSIYFHLSYQDQKVLMLPWYQKLPHKKEELFEKLQVLRCWNM